MSDTEPSAGGGVSIARLPVDKPQMAVDFLHARGGGVMDLIAHFWARLPQTPPLSRGDLHLLVASPGGGDNGSTYIEQAVLPADPGAMTGAMLYVPKAHRADVLAADAATAGAFARYIARVGAITPVPVAEAVAPSGVAMEEAAPKKQNGSDNKTAIDFLTGTAESIEAMIPHLLPMVHKRTPARQIVNHVMQLPAEAAAQSDPCVRPAKEGDNAVLNRWRNMYKQERGILFDADVDAWVQSGRVFVYEADGNIVALAKFDLELTRLVEIGGVFTFPEFRRRGYGGRLVNDLAVRIRGLGKMPTLQVDTQNDPAHHLYQHLGWATMGQLARVWLTG